jgi:hypothetical protein
LFFIIRPILSECKGYRKKTPVNPTTDSIGNIR